MSALAEAKAFVGLHARHMGLKGELVDRVLCDIKDLDGEAPGSWVRAWKREADQCVSVGEYKKASDLYNLARFPCAQTQFKLAASRSAAVSFALHMKKHGIGDRRSLSVEGAPVSYLFQAGPHRRAPLVILMGGIVSLKEQWGGFLALGARLGCAVAILDFPGVGENGLRYGREAACAFGAIMDATALDCDSRRTLVVAPSFGGHLALTQALIDRRIRGLVTVGAPISHFFSEESARRNMPSITRIALSHVCGHSESTLDSYLQTLALSPAELDRLSLPVEYIASLRDEIIPQAEWREAGRRLLQMRVYAFDDVHGSPNHLRQTRLIVLAALLRHAGRARLARLCRSFGRFAFQLEPLSIQRLSA